MGNVRKFNLSKDQYVEITSLQKQGLSIRAIAEKFNYNYRTLRSYLKEADENNLFDEGEYSNQLERAQLIEDLNNAIEENEDLKNQINELTEQLNTAYDKINELNKFNNKLSQEESKIKEIETKLNNKETSEQIEKLVSDLKMEKMLRENPFNDDINKSRLDSFNDGLMEYESGKLFFDKNLIIRINPHTGSLLQHNASEKILEVVYANFEKEYLDTMRKVSEYLPYVNCDWDAMESFNVECRKLFDLYKENDEFNSIIDSLSI